MSPNTERRYRQALTKAGLLAGSEGGLPTLEELKAAVKRERGRSAKDVAIPMVTGLGEVAQVYFGHVGR